MERQVSGLRRGDQRLLAEATGLSSETVKKTIKGERRNPKVLAAIGQLIANRAEFIRKVQQQS